MSTHQLTFSQLFSLAAAESRGAWKRLVFFIICIAVGVGAVMTVKSFSNLLKDAIQNESKGLLAADIEIKGSWEQSEKDLAFQKNALPAESAFQFLKELHAMARYPDADNPKGNSSLLIELKSVPTLPPLYPIYGTLKIKPPQPLEKLLAEGGAVVGPSFLWRTHLEVGDTFMLGKEKVRINGTVISEPDRISRAFSIGPRVFVSMATLDAADLIHPGSRVKNRTLIRLPDSIPLEKALVILERGLTDKSVSIRTYKDMESSLTNSIERMGQYLGAVGVIALLMGGIGVAMIVRIFMVQKLDTIAVLNCLGASSRTILKVYLLQSLILGILGSLLGVGLGFTLQYLLPAKLVGLLDIVLEPRFYPMAAFQSLTLGVLITLLFCLWPLTRAAKTKPLRLFRRNFEEEKFSMGSLRDRWLLGILSLAGGMLIIFWQAGSVKRGSLFLIALGVSIFILVATSILALKIIKKIPPPKNITRRYGLANLYRPSNQATSIITCLGMGIMLVLTVRLVQMDMLAMFKENTEIKPPNYFFIDIQSDQTETFLALVDKVAPEAERTLTPLIRSRLYSAEDRLASEWQYKDRRREEWFINREFVITHSSGPLPKDNTIIKGKWWNREEASVAQVSLEEDAAQRLGVDIGNKIIIDIQGIHVTAPVTSIRKVNWRNMRTNFYMIFSPGALEGAPMTFVSTVHVPPDKELPLQHAVVEALPNITALSTRDIVATVESVVSKLKTLVDFMSVFTISLGLIILSGSIASTKFRRMKESAVLKVLGARRRAVMEVLGIEYAALGMVASVVGIGLSGVLSWAVMEYLVKAGWNLRPGVMVGALAFAVILTTMTGLLSSLDVLREKPFKTLRKLDA
ncbi:MAG: FtsX-like permease family protein [Nitrospinota bacterium]|nr:FtsX-like permease family protein [Nitrospinota bacterium]